MLEASEDQDRLPREEDLSMLKNVREDAAKDLYIMASCLKSEATRHAEVSRTSSDQTAVLQRRELRSSKGKGKRGSKSSQNSKRGSESE